MASKDQSSKSSPDVPPSGTPQDQVRGSSDTASASQERISPGPGGAAIRGSSTPETTRPPRQPGRMPLPD
jgi:hypothetical protein